MVYSIIINLYKRSVWRVTRPGRVTIHGASFRLHSILFCFCSWINFLLLYHHSLWTQKSCAFSKKTGTWVPRLSERKMEGGGGGAHYNNPRTVEEVFRDFKGRRAAILRALTTGLFFLSFFLSCFYFLKFSYGFLNFAFTKIVWCIIQSFFLILFYRCARVFPAMRPWLVFFNIYILSHWVKLLHLSPLFLFSLLWFLLGSNSFSLLIVSRFRSFFC